MVFSVVTGDAQVIILTDSAMPSGFYMMLALIAGVNKAVLALGMQLHQHAHS